MAVKRVWTCDLKDCDITAESDGQPPGWILLVINEAGETQVALHSREHLAAWTGATMPTSAIPYETARSIVRDHERANPPRPKRELSKKRRDSQSTSPGLQALSNGDAQAILGA